MPCPGAGTPVPSGRSLVPAGEIPEPGGGEPAVLCCLSAGVTPGRWGTPGAPSCGTVCALLWLPAAPAQVELQYLHSLSPARSSFHRLSSALGTQERDSTTTPHSPAHCE